MNDFWTGIVAAQTATASTRPAPADRRHRVLSVVGGVAIALLISAGLLVAVAFNG
jgi:hypothetical protein